MKFKQETVYYCEYCKERNLNKGAMTRHEKFCHNNPINKHACLDCKNLETVKTEVEFLRYGEIPDTTTVNKYHCKKLDKILHSFKAVKKGLPRKYPHQFVGSEIMPAQCPQFDFDVNQTRLEADTYL